MLGDELIGDELLGFRLPPPGTKTAMAAFGADFFADDFFLGAAFFLPLGAAFFLAGFFFFLAISSSLNGPDYVAVRRGAQENWGRKT